MIGDADRIRDALSFVPADERDTWVRMAMAVKAEIGDNGLPLWLSWSQSSTKYKERDALAVWRSIRPNGGVRIATLFHLARLHGWRNGNASRSPLRTAPTAPNIKPKADTGPYASRLWEATECDDEAVGNHAYARAKGITWAAGAGRGRVSGSIVGRDADCIIVPCRSISAGQVTGIQAINAIGAKQTFGALGDSALILGNILRPSIPWFVCEGWADAVSLVFHHFDGNAVAAAAFGKGRMETVAQALADRYAPDRIMILEDREAAA